MYHLFYWRTRHVPHKISTIYLMKNIYTYISLQKPINDITTFNSFTVDLVSSPTFFQKPNSTTHHLRNSPATVQLPPSSLSKKKHQKISPRATLPPRRGRLVVHCTSLSSLLRLPIYYALVSPRARVYGRPLKRLYNASSLLRVSPRASAQRA